LTELTRSGFFARTARGGALLALGGGVLAATASPASAGIGQADVPVVTLALAAELVGAEFCTQALAAKLFSGEDERALRRALFNENQHYGAVAQILTDAGQTPGRASDFDFTFPPNAFATRLSSARLGVELETVFMGIYLGGVASLQDATTRNAFARIASSQAQQLSFLAGIAQQKPVGMAFPVPLTVEDGSTALDPYIS
jgi:hypothetical protein